LRRVVFDGEKNPLNALVLQHIGCANAQHSHPALREPGVRSLVAARRCGIVAREPIHLDRRSG
jgi:hypothetical protein